MIWSSNFFARARRASTLAVVREVSLRIPTLGCCLG